MSVPAEPASHFDCLRCGACCADWDVLLSDGEAERFLSDPRLQLLVYKHHLSNGQRLVFMKRDARTGRCAALAGRLGDCRCSIYDQRPGLCRAFEAGCEDCLRSRERRGL